MKASSLRSPLPRICNAGTTRRKLLALGSGLLLSPQPGEAAAMSSTPILSAGAPAEPFVPSQPELIVGGPEGGPLAPWSQVISGAVSRALLAEHALRVAFVGGADGVTACNQFEARTAPDGSTALLISGAPALSWLVGDPRAQFDAGHWLPVATGLTTGMLLAMPGGNNRMKPRRLAVSPADGTVLVAVLGLALLGEDVALVAGETRSPAAALQTGRADLVFIRGPDAARQIASARGAGAVPLFALGAADASGAVNRDPAFPDIPTLPELMPRTPTREHQNLLTAWRAVAAATQIEFALLLPWLTPSGTVAWWRKTMSQLGNEDSGSLNSGPTPARVGGDEGVRIRFDPAASFGLAAVETNSAASLALRKWLASAPP